MGPIETVIFALFYANVYGAPQSGKPSGSPKVQSDEMVNYINGLGATWKPPRAFKIFREESGTYTAVDHLCTIPTSRKQAGHNDYFRHLPLSTIRHTMGVRPRMDKMKRLQPSLQEIDVDDVELPDEFDARKQWPECPTISEIHDQSNCMASWAFAAAAAISDRICIATKGKEKPHISAADLISCCRDCASGTGFGCNGGRIEPAWEYWVTEGLVTGGNYTSQDGCKPYPLAPCEHHMNGSLPECSPSIPVMPKCDGKCQAGYQTTYQKDKYYGKTSYKVRGYENIHKEIMTNGPVGATFTAYEDFLSYKSGVYQHITGKKLAFHALRILGWGVENGTAYWLAANPWNREWGDNGYIKIIRGRNECGIEDEVVAGIPKIN